MDEIVKAILDTLPTVVSRSRLEPCRELISEMRNRRYSYREITKVLAEKCNVRVSPSTLHDFVQRHLKSPPRGSQRPSAPESVEQRIAAVKRRSSTVRDDSSQFQFDTSEPLRLKGEK